jgi:hypothetical protein
MASPGVRCFLVLLWSVMVITGMLAGPSHGAQPPSDLADREFYGWIFGHGGISMYETPVAARRHLVSLLNIWLTCIDQLSGLTEEQQAKLHMAGIGEIQHFLDAVEQERQLFLTIKHDPNRLHEFQKELRPLREWWISNPFLEGSFFWKTLRKTLPEAQIARLESTLRELEMAERRDLIRWFVNHEHSRLKLNDVQCACLEELLLKETGVSKRLAPFRNSGFLEQVSRIPEPRLKQVFQDAQWLELKKELEWAKQVPPNSSDFDFFLFQQGQVLRKRRVRQAR